MDPLNSWHRVFTGSVQDVSEAMRWIQSIAAELNLPEAKSFDIQVCLEELMSNIVLHGQAPNASQSNGSSGPLSISLTVDTHDDAIVMTLEDNGQPFDVTQAQAKTIDEPLEETEPGGLGIALVRSFATDMQYHRTELGNRVTLQFAV